MSERLQHDFAADDVTSPEKQRAILLSACGATTYQLIHNLLSPKKPMETSFAEIMQLMSAHYQLKPSTIVQRFTFHSHVRQQGETVATFVVQLKKLSEHCEFGDTLDDMLCDRIVCGIDDGQVQRHLLAEPDLTYKKAFDIAQAI